MALKDTYYYKYLNSREKRDDDVCKMVLDELNRLLDNKSLDEDTVNNHILAYIEKLRHRIFDIYGKPSFAVPNNVSLLPRMGQNEPTYTVEEINDAVTLSDPLTAKILDDVHELSRVVRGEDPSSKARGRKAKTTRKGRKGRTARTTRKY